MHFDFDTLSGRDRSKLMHSVVVPRPIALVVTRDGSGMLNAAPFSFFNVVSGDPAMVVLGVGESDRNDDRRKDTAANISDTGQFVVNMVDEAMAEAMNLTSATFPREVDELQIAGLATTPSVRVEPPCLADSPASLECELQQTIDISESRYLFLGRVVVLHVKDELMLDAERLYVDTPAFELIARMHGSGWYARTSDLFQMKRPK